VEPSLGSRGARSKEKPQSFEENLRAPRKNLKDPTKNLRFGTKVLRQTPRVGFVKKKFETYLSQALQWAVQKFFQSFEHFGEPKAAFLSGEINTYEEFLLEGRESGLPKSLYNFAEQKDRTRGNQSKTYEVSGVSFHLEVLLLVFLWNSTVLIQKFQLIDQRLYDALLL
jgi:hypothetical protein